MQSNTEILPVRVASYEEFCQIALSLTDYTVVSPDTYGFLIAQGIDPSSGGRTTIYQGSNGALIYTEC